MPSWLDANVCLPAWMIPLILLYRACVWSVLILGGQELTKMTDIVGFDMAVLIAVVAGAVVASILYNVWNLLGTFHEGQTKATETKVKALEEGRELTALEKQKIANWSKFNRLFVWEGLVNAVVASILAFVVMAYIGVVKLGIDGDPIPAFGATFLVALVVAFVIDMTVTSAPAKAKWESKKKALYDAFLANSDKVVEVVAQMSGKEKLIQKYLKFGFDQDKATEMAEKALVQNPELLDE